ncbi:ABC transporter substrate-binding protein [Pseudoroseomonas ludipueritiae]|uniref:ABC transporter substrate-binding protein n=1 Tax=Pseudoroseomonas ludipueritiae TaxID=198093 RepID=A0ABR7REB9_9PROT|nr:ABC transporter substrate-binding protein [Pseudoroseomonas ludipueritiae]MBC9179822.1 ABC transporter substrate-binding protein [Pseudoroseomonas ludipueritiae]
MIERRRLLGSAAALAAAPLLARPALAQGAALKIGMITSLSGPGAYLGQDIRDGFALAMEVDSGKLGGVPVQLLVEDDALKPGQGKQIAERFMQNEKIRLLTGIVFSNVLGATVPDVLDAGGIYVSPNASPSNMAGKECHPNFWSVAWQNDSLHEAAGQAARNLGYKKVFVLAPNYQAGKDAITGFKRKYALPVAGEIYTRLDQTDYAAEMAQIRAAQPDAIYQFHPGGLGIAFLKQYVQAGLSQSIPMVLSSPSMDYNTMTAVGEAALGITVTAHWNSDFDNAANRGFLAAFQAKYNRMPTYYAEQGYDTALAIGAALRGTKGQVEDTEAFRKAMMPAKFESPRGKFAFGPNQHPVCDWFMLKVQKGSDGKLALVTQPGKVLENYGDAHSAQCKF